MLDYAVIGTGWIVQSFIDGAALDGEMRLAGVCSRSLEKGRAFAEKNGCDRVFTSPEELAESDIPAVYIASPNSCHARQTELMLKAGKHVLCEKPITVTPAELMYLQSIAAEKGVVYAEAIMYMFNPDRETLKKAVSSLGKVTSAHLDFSQLSSKYAAYKRGELPNIFNPSLATGCLEDLGIYCVYPALDLFGEPEDLLAYSSFMASGADGSGTAVLGYDGLTVTLTYSKLGQSRAGSEIYGDEGTLMLDSVSQLTGMNLALNTGRYSEGTVEALVGEKEKAVLMGYEAAGFRKIIESPEENAAFYAELQTMSLRVSRLMEQIREKAGIKFDYIPLEG